MDTKEKVLEYLGLSKIGRKCPTDKKVSEFMPVLVEKANGDRTYAVAKWREEIKRYEVIYDPDCVCVITKIINGYDAAR
ncbi:MAG TPA: hypothetical protein PLY62_03420 [Bacteroidales bacterium]|jgi:hypothetical protein|nr:hypothetical protein [Bacteroidales bacterium]